MEDELCILVGADWSRCGIFLRLTWRAWWLPRWCLPMKWVPPQCACTCAWCAQGVSFTCVCFTAASASLFEQERPVETQRSAMLSGSEKIATFPAWHYKCAIFRRKRPPCLRCDRTSLLDGPLLTHLTRTNMAHVWYNDRDSPLPTALPSNPFIVVCSLLASCSITHFPHLAAENCICIMLFVFCWNHRSRNQSSGYGALKSALHTASAAD